MKRTTLALILLAILVVSCLVLTACHCGVGYGGTWDRLDMDAQ